MFCIWWLILCHFIIIIYQQHTCKSMHSSARMPAVRWETYQSYFFNRNFARPLKLFYLLNQPVSIDFKSRTLIVEILFQGCAVVHFQEQSISFTVFGQRVGIYIKNRQTGREKIDGILFPAGSGRERERESKTERVWSTVCLLSPVPWKTLLVQRSLFSLVIWIASAAEA